MIIRQELRDWRIVLNAVFDWDDQEKQQAPDMFQIDWETNIMSQSWTESEHLNQYRHENQVI